MDANRKIRKVIMSQPTLEGAGVHLRRAFAFREVPMFDPFLLLDDFRSGDPHEYLPGFPWHPHRGIETITYMLDGKVEHGDSMGNEGVIGPGDVQWMTAGSGIIHQEMPKGDAAGRMGGFQLWANLPASHKMMDPRYRGIASRNIPRAAAGSGIIHQEMPKGDAAGRMGGFQLWANLPASHKMMDPRYRGIASRNIPRAAAGKGATVRVICGKVGEVEGPVKDVVTDPEYLDVTLAPGTEFLHPTRKGHTVFAYVIEGKVSFCREKNPFHYETEGVNYFDFQRDPFLKNGSLVLFTDGEQLAVSTEDDSVRFLLVSGKPIGEPVAWYGPIVMNTQAELETAFEEYERGTFIKYKKP